MSVYNVFKSFIFYKTKRLFSIISTNIERGKKMELTSDSIRAIIIKYVFVKERISYAFG